MDDKTTPMPDLSQLAEQVHNNSVQHGFWEDKNLNAHHYLCLVACELAEAVEAHRSDREADCAGYKKALLESVVNSAPHTHKEIQRALFCACIKDTTADELADAVIRMLDLACAYDCDLHENVQMASMDKRLPFTQNVWAIIRVLASPTQMLATRLASSIVSVRLLCQFYDIDLWWHVEQKMQYNASRPYLHGKKY